MLLPGFPSLLLHPVFPAVGKRRPSRMIMAAIAAEQAAQAKLAARQVAGEEAWPATGWGMESGSDGGGREQYFCMPNLLNCVRTLLYFLQQPGPGRVIDGAKQRIVCFMKKRTKAARPSGGSAEAATNPSDNHPALPPNLVSHLNATYKP